MKISGQILPLLFCIFLLPRQMPAQEADTTDNYFVWREQMMDFFLAQAAQQGIDYWEVDGWKGFVRRMLKTKNRHDPAGKVSAFSEALREYRYHNHDHYPVRSPQWEYIGHRGLYPERSGSYNCFIGQGNINRIWVNHTNHNHIIAGGNYGGIWQTIDGGDFWQCISDTEPLMDGCRSLWVDQQNPARIYVLQGNGFYSHGLFYTGNGGESWVNNTVQLASGGHLFPTATTANLPREWSIHPENDSVMFLLTFGKLLRSTDAGTSWEVILKKRYSFWTWEQSFNDIAFDPDDPSVLYVGGQEVFRLEHNGAVVVDITQEVLQYSMNTTGWYKVLIGTQPAYPDKVWFAVKSWGGSDALVCLDKTTGIYELMKAQENLLDHNKMTCIVSPVDQNHIMIGGINTTLYDHHIGLALEINRCNPPGNWTHVDVRDAVYLSDSAGREVIFFGNDGGVFKAEPSDDGWNYTYLADDGTDGIQNGHLHGFASSNSETDILYAGFQDMGSALEVDGKWYYVPIRGDGGPGVIDHTDPDYMYLSGFNSPAFFKRSTDGGQTFTPFFSTIDHQYPPAVLNPADPTQLFIGDVCRLYRFDDARHSSLCDTILHIADDGSGAGRLTVDEIAVAESNPEVMYVATGRYWPSWKPQLFEKSLFKTDDGGSTWTDLTANITHAVATQPITGIATDAADAGVAWLCFGGIASSGNPAMSKKVYRTTDGGESWQPMADGLPPKIPANDLYFDKTSGCLFLANDVGVYAFDEKAGMWVNISGNLPSSYILQLQVNAALGKLRVGTHGRGIWQTDLPGRFMEWLSGTATPESQEQWHNPVVTINPKPNPSNGIVLLGISNAEPCAGSELKVFDVYGNLILAKPIRPGQKYLQLDTSGWPTGMYLAAVFSNGKMLARCKLLVE